MKVIMCEGWANRRSRVTYTPWDAASRTINDQINEGILDAIWNECSELLEEFNLDVVWDVINE